MGVLKAHSYKSVSRILSTDGDKRIVEQNVQLKIVHDNLRGADYYRENFEQKEV